MAARLSDWAERLSFWTDSLTRSYARIFFADSRLFGAAVLASTMVIPAHGLFGLMAALITNLTALLIGLDRTSIRQGLHGFNGVLAGLGIGFFYGWSPQSLAMLAIASVLVLFLRIALDYVLEYYLGLPAMSLPFTIVTWLLLLASIEFGHLEVSFDRLLLFNLLIEGIPTWTNCFLCNIGAVLFQVNALSGLIIGLGLLFYSPLAFLLVGVGFFAGGWLHDFFGIDASFISRQFLGFNYMLTALALGGIFARPSAGSLLAALAGVGFAVLVLTSLVNFLPPLLTPLAMPFNLAVLLVLYLLKNRSYPSLGLQLVPPLQISRPEVHLLAGQQRPAHLFLPFNGKWQVTQGIDGRYTHRDDWSFAYDFMATDSQRSTYRGEGVSLEEYHSFGLPVIAPVSGRVAAVCAYVPDNPVGRENLEDNWGNYVIIEYGAETYCCLAHLKQDSLKVAVGQRVEAGQIIGLCGNSGRSPYPHLHLQVQMSPMAGAPAVPFRFGYILNQEETEERMLHHCVLQEGAIVQNFPCLPGTDDVFPQAHWAYAGNDRTEEWRLGADQKGERWLESSPRQARVGFSLTECVLRFGRYRGNRQSGLFLLARYMREVPLVASGTWHWRAYEPDLPTGARYWLFAPLSLVGIRFILRLDYELKSEASRLEVSIIPAPCLAFGPFRLPLSTRKRGAAGGRPRPPVQIIIRKGRGLERLEMEDYFLELVTLDLKTGFSPNK